MKFATKISTLIFVLFTLLVSGCVGSADAASGSSTDSIVVKNLKSQGTFAGADSTTSVSFDVENAGSATATNACAQIFGQVWTVKDSKSQDKTAWYSLGDNTDPTTSCEKGGTLKPAIPSAKVPADKDSVIADFDTSKITNPVGDSQDYKVLVRVYSNYATRAVSQINALSSNEYSVRQRSGKLDTQTISSQATAGPVAVTIEGNEPLKIDSTRSVSTKLRIINVGGGRVFKPVASATGQKTYYTNLGTNDYNYVKISNVKVNGATAVGTTNFKCGTPDASGNIYIKVPDGSDGALVTCSFQVSGSSDLVDTNIDLEVTVDYGYMTQYETSVTVKQNPDSDQGTNVAPQTNTPTTTNPTTNPTTTPTSGNHDPSGLLT